MFKGFLLIISFFILCACKDEPDTLNYLYSHPTKDGADISAFPLKDSVPDIFRQKEK